MRNILILFVLLFTCTAQARDNAKTFKLLGSSVSMAATFNSSVADTGESPNFSVHAVWSGGSSPIGALNLQGSNDKTVDHNSVSHWTDLNTNIYIGSIAVSGTSGSYLFNIANGGFKWLRAVYTRTSGSGTMDVTFFGKGS
jgi:hypothetical protein